LEKSAWFLFKATAETLLAIAADPKHLGAERCSIWLLIRELGLPPILDIAATV
jgi:hypothetical protein